MSKKSVGMSFFKRLLEDEKDNITFLSDFSLSKPHFKKDELRIFNFIENHIHRYGELPSLETVENETGTDFPDTPDETLGFWAEQVRNRTFSSMMKRSLKGVVEAINEGNTPKAVSIISDLNVDLLELRGGGLKVKKLSELLKEVLDQHDERQARSVEEEADIPFGFSHLDSMSDGATGGDTVALVGESGIGKTYVLCSMANAAHKAGKTLLFISMEMNALQIARRIAALRLRLNETSIRKGKLSTFLGVKKLKNEIVVVREEEDEAPFYIVDGELVLKVEDLEAYIKALNPDVVYVDGAYILKKGGYSRNRWDDIADVAENVKLIAGRNGVPIIGTYQFNDKGGIYGGRSIKQLASIVLHLVYDDEINEKWEESDTRIVEINKGRFGEKGRFRISYDMYRTNISELDVLATEKPKKDNKKRGRRSE